MTDRMAILLKILRERMWGKHAVKFYFILADHALTACIPRQQIG